MAEVEEAQIAIWPVSGLTLHRDRTAFPGPNAQWLRAACVESRQVNGTSESTGATLGRLSSEGDVSNRTRRQAMRIPVVDSQTPPDRPKITNMYQRGL